MVSGGFLRNKVALSVLGVALVSVLVLILSSGGHGLCPPLCPPSPTPSATPTPPRYELVSLSAPSRSGNQYVFTARVRNPDVVLHYYRLTGYVDIAWTDGQRSVLNAVTGSGGDKYQVVAIPGGGTQDLWFQCAYSERPFSVSQVNGRVELIAIDPPDVLNAKATETAVAENRRRVQEAMQNGSLTARVEDVGGTVEGGTRWNIGVVVTFANSGERVMVFNVGLTFRFDPPDGSYFVAQLKRPVESVSVPPRGTFRLVRQLEFCSDLTVTAPADQASYFQRGCPVVALFGYTDDARRSRISVTSVDMTGP